MRTSVLNGTYGNLAASSPGYKCAIVDSTSNISATSTTWAAVTGEVTNSGYTAGGLAIGPLVIAGSPNPTVKGNNNAVWTVGAALTAKWAVIYEIGGNVLAYALLDSGGASVTTNAGQQLTVDTTTNPIITAA
jgi:hypothetical protein